MTTTRIESRDEPSAAPANSVALRDHHGSLRSKLVLSLAAMFFLFLLVDEFVRRQVFLPQFGSIERAAAVRDGNRVLAALNARVDHLGELARPWAGRYDSLFDHDQPGDTMSGGQTDASRKSDSPSDSVDRRRTFPSSLDWAAVLSDRGWRRIDGEPQLNDESALPAGRGMDSITKRCREGNGEQVSGITRLDDQTMMMFAAIPLSRDGAERTTEGASKPKSYLAVGQAIDEPLIEMLRKQTQVDFSLGPPVTSSSESRLTIDDSDPEVMVVAIGLTGVEGESLATAHVRVPRDIKIHSSQTMFLARNSFIFGAAAALLLLLLMLQRIVIGPLTSIREHSDRIAETGFDTEPLVLPGNDEIGELATAFDHMMHRLRDAQSQLTEASRAAGRSQVASTVIHNVGNVLTNVNSLLDVASETVEHMRIDPLSQLADRLRQEDADAAMLAATPDYLQGLASSLDKDRDTVSQLMMTLHDNIRHIHDVIRDQQRHTGRTFEATPVVLEDVVNEAIGCCRARLDQDQVAVTVEGVMDVLVFSDRSLLLQSVINVIGNARHALRESDGKKRELKIRARVVSGTVRISFRDNGVGMNDETLSKVFDAHFTTRTSGSGLGLHFCANAVRRLGGSVWAESDGLGHGATFIFELPVAGEKSSRRQESLPMPVGAV